MAGVLLSKNVKEITTSELLALLTKETNGSLSSGAQVEIKGGSLPVFVGSGWTGAEKWAHGASPSAPQAFS